MVESKLNIWALAIGFGLASGIFVFAQTLIAFFSGWGSEVAAFYTKFFWGYTVTPEGALVGLMWGFIICFIYGAIVAGFYNFFMSRCPKTEEEE